MSQVGSVLSKPLKFKRITKEGLGAELKAVVVYGGVEKAPNLWAAFAIFQNNCHLDQISHVFRAF